MSTNTSIEWTDATWNPVRGCTRVSPGCGGPSHQGGCYAEKIAARFSGPGQPFHGFAERSSHGGRWTGKVALVDEMLTLPLRWRKPRRIFVNSMSDLFHEGLPDEAIDKVFAIMALCPQHTFQVLTKRSARMRAYFERRHSHNEVELAAERIRPSVGKPFSPKHVLPWPLPNVWLGVSAEDQPRADERIPDLLATPAAVRFVSLEPLLGAIDLAPFIRHTKRCDRLWSDFQWPQWVPEATRQEVMDFWRREWGRGPNDWMRSSIENGHPSLGTVGRYRTLRTGEPFVEGRFIHSWNNIGRVLDDEGKIHCVSAGKWVVPNPYLDWVVAGGESGPAARPMHPDWARSLRDQCTRAGVPFFFKQWGEWEPRDEWSGHLGGGRFETMLAIMPDGSQCPHDVVPQDVGAHRMALVGKKKSGAELDCRTWREFPHAHRTAGVPPAQNHDHDAGETPAVR